MNERGFFSTADIAAIVGVTTKHVTNTLIPALADQDVHKVSPKRWWVRAKAVHDWLVQRAVQGMRGAIGDPDELALAAGGSSPALERWRQAKAQMAEIDLDRVKSQTLDRGRVHEVFGQVGNLIREVGEQLQRDGHHSCWRRLDQALAGAIRKVEKELAGDAPAEQEKV